MALPGLLISQSINPCTSYSVKLIKSNFDFNDRNGNPNAAALHFCHGFRGNWYLIIYKFFVTTIHLLVPLHDTNLSMSAELPELTIKLGPRHNIRIRRPYIKRDNFEAKYGGYIVFYSALVIIVFCIVRVDRVLFLATHFHASFGDADAQFLLGQHYVQGENWYR